MFCSATPAGLFGARRMKELGRYQKVCSGPVKRHWLLQTVSSRKKRVTVPEATPSRLEKQGNREASSFMYGQWRMIGMRSLPEQHVRDGVAAEIGATSDVP